MKLSDDLQNNLTDGQKEAFRAAMQGNSLFITGGAGTGKSTVMRLIIKALQDKGKNVIVCAPTGAAATVAGGATIHRAFGLPSTACINEKTNTIKYNASKEICAADTVVIDEISMCRMDVFDSMAVSIRKAEGKTGRHIQFIVVGDFFQLPPILDNKHGEKKLFKKYYGDCPALPYAFLGKEWNKCGFLPCILTESKRQKDAEFIYNLNLARTGDLACLNYFNSYSSPFPFPDAVNLYSYNDDVNVQNRKSLSIIAGPEYRFETVFDDQLSTKDRRDADSTVFLKEGCRVIITVNDTGNGQDEDLFAFERPWFSEKKAQYHNGSLGTVQEIRQDDDSSHDSVIVKVDGGTVVEFQRHRYNVYDYILDGKKLKRVILGSYTQIPLRPAYALTIHRGQGQTYDQVNLDPGCKNCGQLYVGLSRVRNLSGLHLRHKIRPDNLMTSPKVVQFYHDLLNPPEVTISEGETVETEAVPMIAEADSKYQKESAEQKPKKKVTPRLTKPVKPKGISPTPKGGRPSRYPNGNRRMRIPTEIADVLEPVLDRMYPPIGDGNLDVETIEKLKVFLKQLYDDSQQ